MSKKQYELAGGRYILIDPDLEIHVDEDFSFTHLPSTPAECRELQGVLVNAGSGGDVLEVYSIEQGIKQGPALHFHPAGSIKWESYYKQGFLHGPSKYFSEKGTLLSITWFYEGREEGCAYQYTIQGSLYSKLSFRRGRLHGTQEYYYEDGTLKSRLSYVDGVLHGDVELFFVEGKVKRTCHFIQGKKHGIDKIFSAEGVILDEGGYEMGLPVGMHVRRYLSGALREEIFYEGPTKFRRKEWNENGSLKEGEGRGSSL